MNHGHPYHALYGDDGQMTCALCPADFRRDPLNRLYVFVLAGRRERMAAVNPAGDLCKCGHTRKRHTPSQRGDLCQAIVYTDRPLGAGAAYTCPCKHFSSGEAAE